MCLHTHSRLSGIRPGKDNPLKNDDKLKFMIMTFGKPKICI